MLQGPRIQRCFAEGHALRIAENVFSGNGVSRGNTDEEVSYEFAADVVEDSAKGCEQEELHLVEDTTDGVSPSKAGEEAPFEVAVDNTEEQRIIMMLLNMCRAKEVGIFPFVLFGCKPFSARRIPVD